MSPETLSSNLGALRNQGSVFGLIFTRGTETLFNAAEFSLERTHEIVSTMDDISYYFESEGRDPDQLALGYDGANLLLLFTGDYRMILLHHNSGEVDQLADAARSFLKDFQAANLAGKVRATATRDVSRPTVSPTEPIAPAV